MERLLAGMSVILCAVCQTVLGQSTTATTQTTKATTQAATATTQSTNSTTTTQYYATTPGLKIVNFSQLDSFLTFPPEYVALLGLGLAFLLLYAIVMIIVCMTARGGRRERLY